MATSYARVHASKFRGRSFPEMSAMLIILAEDFGDSLGGDALNGRELSLIAQINGRTGRLHICVRRFETHNDANPTGRTGRLDSRQLELVCAAMRGQLQNGVSLSKIAALVGMSAPRLSRAFQATTGLTFTAFLTRLRIGVAMRLMTETDLPLCQIAVSSGFADQPHFSRSFVRVVGLTPFKWRFASRPKLMISTGFAAGPVRGSATLAPQGRTDDAKVLRLPKQRKDRNCLG
jgi:AraC-like DNA-binding protein